MKKNTMMRIASVLMVAVLLSTCAISSTFAKYVSSDSATDTARIAKWGVEVTATGKDAFALKYDNEAKTDGTKVVSATTVTENDNGKVIAPGTKGDLGGISITGTPEVMVNVSVSATLTLSGWHTDGDENNLETEHCPLIFKVGNEEIKIGAQGIDTIEDLQTAVVDKFTALTQENIAANTNLGNTKNVSVSWEWPFDPNNGQNDTNDTALGDLNTAPTITFSCSASVTQVD